MIIKKNNDNKTVDFLGIKQYPCENYFFDQLNMDKKYYYHWYNNVSNRNVEIQFDSNNKITFKNEFSVYSYNIK